MSKATLETLNPSWENSFMLRRFNQKEFTSPYHFHPEYELTLIVKGEGNRYIGNHSAVYHSGDLVLLGANLPHCWKTQEDLKEEINASSIVIQFNENFLGIDFFSKPELTLIHKLLEKSKQGIQFLSNTVNEITNKLYLLSEEKNAFKKLLALLEILYIMAISKEYILLDQIGIVGQTLEKRERLNKVRGYIVDNFKSEIFLETAAAMVCMTPNAFCKYYKKNSGQTFIETVTDYRINHAAQQLIHSEKPILDISFESGFGDISHFYKLFKRKFNQSPVKYRKKFTYCI